MNRGFLVLAQNNDHVDYLACASVLARRIKQIMPNYHVTLVTDVVQPVPGFDLVREFPHGDQCQDQQWKLANDWQVYDASPYEHTIKLEADIYLPRSIEHWWDTLATRDLVLTTTIRDYTNQITPVRYYRKIVDDNKLPDTYNAITYFRKSLIAQEFFTIVRNIFMNWDQYRSVIRCYDQEQATTDFVYALAARIIGEDQCTIPNFTDMSMIHMKNMINGGFTENWTDEYIWEIHDHTLRINTIPQLYPFHYHIKSFAALLQQELYG